MPEKDRRYKLNPFTGKFDRSLLPTDEGTAAGLDGQVQFNDDGALGGDGGLTYNKDTDTLSVGGFVELGNEPTDPNHAVTKQYVDDAVADAGGLICDTIDAGETFVVDVCEQLVVFEQYNIEGDLELDGNFFLHE